MNKRKLQHPSEIVGTWINTRYWEIISIGFVREVMPQKVTKFYNQSNNEIKGDLVDITHLDFQKAPLNCEIHCN